ncbi:hypothetical protein GCM10009811_26910 [Nostocoides veronense]|uniref:Uncharacterized protein n=1 Tax=Nostocoides veronense TaxID=330836 RepID=A0ABP4Y2J7_9MICO
MCPWSRAQSSDLVVDILQVVDHQDDSARGGYALQQLPDGVREAGAVQARLRRQLVGGRLRDAEQGVQVGDSVCQTRNRRRAHEASQQVDDRGIGHRSVDG